MISSAVQALVHQSGKRQYDYDDPNTDDFRGSAPIGLSSILHNQFPCLRTMKTIGRAVGGRRGQSRHIKAMSVRHVHCTRQRLTGVNLKRPRAPF